MTGPFARTRFDRAGWPDPSARYSIDGSDPCSWRELLEANQDAPLPEDDLFAIGHLGIGREVCLDLGAGGIATVRRVS